MKQNMRQQYNDTINLISHLILTKPKPVMTLLMKYGVRFEEKPTKKELADEVVEVLKSTNEKFQEDLSNLLTVHIQFRGKEMLALDRSKYSSYDGDEDEDEFWGALAKGAVGIIGGLFGKKRRRRRRSGGGNAAALAASRAAAAKRQADAQAARVRRDFQMKMQAMEAQRRREQAEARRRQAAAAAAAERRRREEAERRRREDEAKSKKEAESKKKSNMMLMVGGGVGLLLIAGIFMAKSNSQKPMMPYVPPQPISNR
ncbi:hypothetical protein [Aquimarina megaterium]|uniref:hypothetical protein n=1 Tax=Aquimarina megaterium TaxID=1443666 RepID=UPI0004727ABA|nr:hypothetical protein [Aquimarina megaterium]